MLISNESLLFTLVIFTKNSKLNKNEKKKSISLWKNLTVIPKVELLKDGLGVFRYNLLIPAGR